MHALGRIFIACFAIVTFVRFRYLIRRKRDIILVFFVMLSSNNDDNTVIFPH